jgi:signal transduction histidine kinase
MTEVSASPHPRVRLRSLTIVGATALTLLALGACVALKVVTDIMDGRAVRLREAAHQVHFAEAVRADLLQFSRLSNMMQATHDSSRANDLAGFEQQLHQDFDDLRRSALPGHQPMIDKADAEIRSYFAARNEAETAGASSTKRLVVQTDPIERTLASLDEVVRIDSADVAAEEARIGRWSSTADWISYAIGLLVVVGTAAVLVLNYRLVLKPLLDLADAMKRFAGGRRDSRAKPGRADELATAADNFNEMADLITQQHSHMLDFLGGATHEVMAPVQLVRIALEDLLPPKPLPAPEKTRSRIVVAYRELDRLERTIRNNLDASRVEWQRLDLQQGQEDVRPLVEQAVRLYQNFSSVHQVQVTVTPRPAKVYADPQRISQVFHTLLLNAIERSPRGGIVQVEVGEAEGEARVNVTDHGAEIPRQEQAKLFEPFNRPSPAIRGTGSVALSTARRIVEAHGGHLDVSSQAGVGTTFRVRLPLAERTEASTEATDGRAPAHGAAGDAQMARQAERH